MNYTFRIALIACTLLTSATGGADILRLEGGDRLSGSLVEISGGALSFRTKLAGKIFVPLDQVTGLRTTGLVAISLGDDKLLTGRLETSRGQIWMVSPSGEERRLLILSEVTSFAVVPAAAEIEEDRAPLAGGATDVSIETGYRWRTGTVDYSGPYTKVELIHRSQKTTFSGKLDTEFVGDQGRIDRFFDAEATVTLERPGAWEPEIVLELERNRDKALDLRADLSVGMAKDFFASETQTFRGSLGAGVSVARFDPGPLRRDEGTPGRPRFHEGPRSDKDLNLHLSFRYTRKLFRGAYIEEILVLRPSLTDIGHGRAEFESSVYVPLSPKLKLRIDVLVDYEDRLHFNGLDDWRTSVGAGIRFDF